MAIPRQTFVLHVHEDGGTVLEDVATHERVVVDRLAELGDVVARRLQEGQATELHRERHPTRDGGPRWVAPRAELEEL